MINVDVLGLSFERSFGMPVTIVRPSNDYEHRQSARDEIPNVIGQALSDTTVRLGALDTTRDFTYVGDTAWAFALIGAHDDAVGEAVNVGSGQEISIRDIVQKVGSICGRDLRIECDEKRVRPPASEVSRLLSDSSKARRLGWRPGISMDEGLGRTTEWVREHLDLYRPREYAV